MNVCVLVLCMQVYCIYACMYSEYRKKYTILIFVLGLVVLASSMCTGLLIS